MKYPQLVSMPSAVSDWLEEQLEARGIDSEVYTRYILSLLHAHTLDVIYPEEDLSFSQLKKDGGRGPTSHKRIRRTGAWWRHADADAEQIKRSAAVECLMSAAEQNCEIESLVDELCEKLKEVNSKAENSSNETNQDTKTNKESPKQRKISPRELAEKYYAAFPPLNQKEDNSYPASNINLVAGKWPSPDKSLNNIDLIAAKWTSSGSPKKTKRKPKRQPYDAMKSASRTSHNRNRFGYKKVHCVRTLSREMADNRANWEFVYNNNNYKINDQCLDSFVPTLAERVALPEDFNMDENDLPVQWMKHWMADAEKSNQNSVENNLQRSVVKKPQFIPVYPSSIWSDNEAPRKSWSKNDASRPKPFDYYPGTGGGELWSSSEPESAIPDKYQRYLEEEECAIKMEYERPYVEDIKVHIGGQWAGNMEERSVQIGGRWSTKMEQPLEQVSQDALDFGLVKSSNNNSHEDLLDFNIQNEANSLLQDINRCDSTCLFRTFRSLPADIFRDQDSNMMPFDKNECLFDVLTMSLMKINHSKECSAFDEYVRTPAQYNDPMLALSGPYSRPFGRPFKGPNMPAKVVPTPQIPKGGMWESPLVLFRPIQTPPPKTQHREEPTRKYQDGATFAIKGNLDKVEFKRTNSGTLFLDDEFGDSKKYHEYHWQPPTDESVKLPRMLNRPDSDEFKLKFWVSQNDKVGASQTDDQMGLLSLAKSFSEIEETAHKLMESMDFGKEETELSEKEALKSEGEKSEKCEQSGGRANDDCKDFLKIINPEEHPIVGNVLDIAEIVWKNADENCKLCNGKHQWPNFIQKFDINWNADTLKDIWEGTGMCRSRPQNTEQDLTPPIETCTEIREEIKENAEILLSGLSSVQQSFSDSSRLTEALLKNEDAPTDRKRRHSYMDSDAEMWSFATRLQEDCLINLSTLPTRRSVTL